MIFLKIFVIIIIENEKEIKNKKNEGGTPLNDADHAIPLKQNLFLRYNKDFKIKVE